MKITMYRCDDCNAVLSDREKFTPHINLDQSRIQYITKISKNNYTSQNLLTGIRQFCNPECLAKYLHKAMPDKPLEVLEDFDHEKSHLSND